MNYVDSEIRYLEELFNRVLIEDEDGKKGKKKGSKKKSKEKESGRGRTTQKTRQRRSLEPLKKLA